MELECRDIIKSIDKGIKEVETKGQITHETKHEILNKHLEFVSFLKDYKKSI